MKIKTVSVERLYSLPGYNHVKFGLTADLEEGEDHSTALNWLINDLDEKKKLFDEKKEFERMKQNKLYQARSEVRRLESMEYDDCSNKDDLDTEDDIPF